MFFYGRALLLITHIHRTDWINLGTRKLTSLQDTNLYLNEYENKQFKCQMNLTQDPEKVWYDAGWSSKCGVLEIFTKAEMWDEITTA